MTHNLQWLVNGEIAGLWLMKLMIFKRQDVEHMKSQGVKKNRDMGSVVD